MTRRHRITQITCYFCRNINYRRKTPMKNIISISFILFVLIGCTSTSEKLGADDTVQSFSKNEKQENEIEKRIADTDLQEKLAITNSLFFTKEDGSSFEVKAFLDKSDAVLKVEQKFVNGKTNEYGTILFYVLNGKKYASKERFEDRSGEKPTFIERVSYYNEKEKVTQTKIRKAFFEEELDAQPFEKTEVYDCSITLAMNALNQEGIFETRFQGFVFNGNTTYVTVGEAGGNGYISALLLQYEDETTRKLMKNQKKMLGKKLDLGFQKMVDDTGFEFQVLLTVEMAK